MSLITAVILAAGKGSRMKSDLPKVLHRVNGKSMLSYCIEAACKGGAEDVVLVLGHQAQMVRDHLQEDYHYAIQEPQLGTGHALQMAMPAVGLDCQYLLVLCGDTPLLRGETIESLLQYASAERSACTVLSAVLDDPSGYGRLIRDDQGNLQAIVEEKDANQQEKAVREINTGTYCFSFEDIAPLINNLDNNNAQGEYYLTDLIAALV
ncbi:MAG: NTP transferase domain-containing protein, partial [Clostridiales bacterium]